MVVFVTYSVTRSPKSEKLLTELFQTEQTYVYNLAVAIRVSQSANQVLM